VPLGLHGARRWTVLLSTEETPFALDPQPIHIDADAAMAAFSRPGAIVLAVDAGSR